MKLPLIPGAKNFARKHLIKIAVLVLSTVLAVGGFFGWRYYQYRQSGTFAFTKLQAALNPPKPADLALCVDFNTLAQHLSTAIAAAYPYLKKGPDQIHTLKNLIQTTLLKKLMTREEPVKEETDPQKLLQMPLAVLPDDFLAQFNATLAIQQTLGENATLLSTVIKHPVLGQTFSLLLRMDKTPKGWMVRDLINADDLVKQFRAAQLKRMAARRDTLVKKNEATLQRMNKIMPLQSCTAGAGLLSDGKSLILVAQVLARNTSAVTVNNTNISTRFSNAAGEDLLHRYLSATVNTRPGEDFDHRWTLELDEQSDLGQKILHTGPISCSTSWHVMGLNSSEVLAITDIPEIVEDFQ
ncbi:MAG: translation initiation factor IF-2 [Desulfovibrio sp.]|jgi:hypothetical protein|nr:translation initiation factor IF-2 [Desulfovibrio sp.]